jgi:uncharacterized protein (TIGR00661 family)
VKYIFIVQGEGRGHMTQAISLRNLLVENGHEVIKVFIGKSRMRVIPDFFYEKIQAPVTPIDSPNFLVDKDKKGIRVFSSILYNLRRANVYLKSIKTIHDEVKRLKPDAIINFYEMLCGLYFLRYNPPIPHFCIGHQYYLYHPAFSFPKGFWLDKKLLSIHTRLSAARATKHLALSFSYQPDVPAKKIFVVPPLIREEILNASVDDQGYILGYVLNSGYIKEIAQWHETSMDVKVHLFGDGKADELELQNNLTLHKINDEKFIHYMCNCSAFASTAGFESICEAMFLNKPVMMIPTAGHFEQRCNAFDAEKAGAGFVAGSFKLAELSDYITTYNQNNAPFKQWVISAHKLFLLHLC